MIKMTFRAYAYHPERVGHAVAEAIKSALDAVGCVGITVVLAEQEEIEGGE